MRIITKLVNGNFFAATQKINDLKLAHYFVTMSYIQGIDSTAVVFRVESYPDYTHFCERFGDVPMSTEEYFG